jgi:uncharacterized SAM-binding protein YcdF (DUF218 family)
MLRRPVILVSAPLLAVAASVALALLFRVPVLRAVGHILIHETALQPSVAIVPLDGGVPYREQEAARLYHAGWAPLVLLVSGSSSEDRQNILVDAGVPPEAIRIAEGEIEGTLGELSMAAQVLAPDNASVLFVTSPYHTQRVWATWQYVTRGHSPAVVRAATQDKYDPDRWWITPRERHEVLHEYLGFSNLLFRDPRHEQAASTAGLQPVPTDPAREPTGP